MRDGGSIARARPDVLENSAFEDVGIVRARLKSRSSVSIGVLASGFTSQSGS
jgi:hypothetical protein